MKFCPKCGHENNDEVKFCINCGEKFIEEDAVHETVDVDPTPQSSSLAKVSFITGIISVGLLVSMCCFPIAIIVGPIAIVTGIISLVRTPKLSKKQAIIGLVLGSVAFLLSLIMFLCMDPMLEFLKQYMQDYCIQYPDSDECLTYKEAFPEWFQ